MSRSKIPPTPNAELRAGMRDGERCEHCGQRRDEHRGQVMCVSAKAVPKTPADLLIAQGWSKVTTPPTAYQHVLIIGDEEGAWFQIIGFIDSDGDWNDTDNVILKDCDKFPLFWRALPTFPSTNPSTTWGGQDYP